MSACILLSSAVVKGKGRLQRHCQSTPAINHTRQMASGALKNPKIHRKYIDSKNVSPVP